ncbi:hypothetical protein L596_004071 [Steinernema carpocapsae]|uniref:Serine hydrolase domain-containing protein n=1 Tax=Steinernema carpocapsae TaxID=34508 RepID=A0A4V6I872_STECR|nr:hypothetical protein L596_004071 [Steinernema carpocapsae]
MAKDPADSKEKKLLKILCLHGYRQNGTVFREKTGAFRKALKKHAVFDFVDAPHVPVVPAQSNGESSSGAKDDKYTPRAWWFSKAQKTFSSWDETEIAEGFEFSVRDVLQYIKENGPYDGIMGFSQGACMTHLLATMNKKSTAGAENTEKLFKFVIIVAGFKSLSLVHNDQNTVFISNLPSLHIYGTGDEGISDRP